MMAIENSFRVILVDDEPGTLSSLEALLKAHPDIRVIEKINDAAKATGIILGGKPDLLFLDIQMSGKTGFEIAKELHDAGSPPAIIFVTGFDNYAIAAIRHAAFDFLVKPVDPAELGQALERFRNTVVRPDPVDQIRRLVERTLSKPRIKISTAGGFTLINTDDILYIRADWNYSEIFFGGEKSELATMNIGAIMETLPENGFFRISRSLIINVNYLVKVSRRRREATLVKDGREYKFPIPLLNIRKLERFLD